MKYGVFRLKKLKPIHWLKYGKKTYGNIWNMNNIWKKNNMEKTNGEYMETHSEKHVKHIW
jgi:hypothetical protein